MAGTVTRQMRMQFGDTTVIGEYTFAYGDQWDGWDWDEYETDAPGAPNPKSFSLVGSMRVWVEGPGTIHVVYYKAQGQSRNPWREADLKASDGVQNLPTGSGPNPKTVGDLRGADAWRVA